MIDRARARAYVCLLLVPQELRERLGLVDSIMICIECTQPVDSLYTRYSPTNIRSTACPKCNKFADKYIEHDGVIIVIDLLLLKPQAYRHMVFNVLSTTKDGDVLHEKTKRMWLLITLFDVYMTWARAEKSYPPSEVNRYILTLPVLAQYIVFLIYCIVDTATTHITFRYLAKKLVGWNRPNALSTAILISSSSKLFPILMLIWSYDIPIAATAVGWAVSFNSIEVLNTILGCGYTKAVGMTLCAEVAKYLIGSVAISHIILWLRG